MSATRAFKNLAALRDRFVEPSTDEQQDSASLTKPTLPATASFSVEPEHVPAANDAVTATRSASKVDGRRERKVLKVPSVSLSVSVRREIHEQVSAMLFARKMTWIALLDDLLNSYVESAKASDNFPK